jgi:hypothetical protein
VNGHLIFENRDNPLDRSFIMRIAIVSILFVGLAAGSAFAAVAGKYSDGKLTVDLSGTDSLTGTIALGANQYPATAHASGNNLDGSFTTGGNAFPFTATLDGDTMTLVSGGKTYTLQRASAPANPLANPAGAAEPVGIAGYSVVNSTDFGKAMFTHIADAPTVTAALSASINDLSHYFDSRPDIKGGYEDSKNHQSGGAVFTATLKGQAMKGVISCKLQEKGAGVTVVYCRVDAPQAEWAKLSTAPAAPAEGDKPAANAAPVDDPSKVLGDNAQVYSFPDGTGSITLPDGWKTNAQSAIDLIQVQGPADQNVFIGSSRIISTPDSPLVKMAQQNQERMRQMGGNPPPPMIIAEFTDPVQAMQDIWPQLSQLNQARGGPAVHLDQIVDHKDVPAAMQGAKAAVITFDVTRTLNDVSKQYRGIQRVTMVPIGNGSWSFTTTGFTAPIDDFEHDRKLMFAIVQSEKLNQQVVQQRMNDQAQANMNMIKQQGEASAAALQANHDAFMKAQDQRYAAHEQQMAETQAGYDAHNQQFRDDQLQKSRNKDDVVEQIQGYRQVYDTQTGLSGNVDLNDVNGVVNALNQAALDPNRFVQIPLRDLQDPR